MVAHRHVETRTFLADRAPTASDDASQGYFAGDEWIDSTGTPSGGTLQTETVTASQTLDALQEVLLCDATAGAITLTLPAAADSQGRFYYVKKIDSSANAVTIDGASAETIDEAANQVINTQYDSLHIVCDGSEWWII